MTRTAETIAWSILLVLFSVGVARAEMQPILCVDGTIGSRDDLVAYLQGREWGETKQGMGLDSAGQVLEVYASEKTGTWTIIVTSPDGQACMAALGAMWESGPITPLGDPT